MRERTPTAVRALVVAGAIFTTACASSDDGARVFELRITNVTTSQVEGPAGPYEAMFSPGWARVDPNDPIFRVGQPAGPRLRAIAERGDASQFASTPGFGFPEGIEVSYESEPLVPNATYAVRFKAREGDVLSFASMFIPTNDIFLGAEGIALFDDDGEARSGDVTSATALYDAGTEQNEPPGYGPGQPMGGEPGTPEDGVVTRVDGVDAEGHTYPAPGSLVRVELVACASLTDC